MLAATVVLDQLTKFVLIDLLNGHPPVEVLSFFRLVMVWNEGVSFGMFGGTDELKRWFLTIFAVVVAAGLMIWIRKEQSRISTAAIGMIAGGALGNAMDRALYGAVADFFDFHLNNWSWPAFNIADAAITVGVIILIADTLLRGTGRRNLST